MNTTKSILYSRTIWAALVAAIATLLQILDVRVIAPEDQHSLVDGILAVIQLCAAFSAIFFRWKATKKLV